MILIQLSPGAVEICDEIDNSDGTIDENLIFGSDADCAGVDCEDIINAEPSLAGLDGVYWIDPSGSSPFEAYCDIAPTVVGGPCLDRSMEVMETTGTPSLDTGPTPTRLALCRLLFKISSLLHGSRWT